MCLQSILESFRFTYVLGNLEVLELYKVQDCAHASEVYLWLEDFLRGD